MSKRLTLDMKQKLGKSALFLSINKLRAFSHLGQLTNISLSQSSKLFSLSSLASRASPPGVSLAGCGYFELEIFLIFLILHLFQKSLTSWAIFWNSSFSFGNSIFTSSEPMNILSKKVHAFWCVFDLYVYSNQRKQLSYQL